jgi:hypothetical protein
MRLKEDLLRCPNKNWCIWNIKKLCLNHTGRWQSPEDILKQHVTVLLLENCLLPVLIGLDRRLPQIRNIRPVEERMHEDISG